MKKIINPKGMMLMYKTSDLLKEKGIKPSFQRNRIYEFVMSKPCHPTAEDIFEALRDDIPTLSKTTVYNTLNLFIEKDLMDVIKIDENHLRYDIKSEFHAHLKCNICKKIFDIQLDPQIKNLILNGQIHVDKFHFYLEGTCPDCIKEKKD